MRQHPYLAMVLLAALVGSLGLAGLRPASSQGSGLGPNVAPVPITALPFTITTCGVYELRNCVRGRPGESGITVNASNVVIDLGGFTMFGDPVPDTLHGIHVVGGSANVVVRNGTILGWRGDGIRVEQDPVGLRAGLRAQDLRVGECGGDGIHAGAVSTVVDCEVYGNGGDGIETMGLARVEDCYAFRNGQHGIVANSRSVVRHNRCDLHTDGEPANEPFRAGIRVEATEGVLVEENHVTRNEIGIDGDCCGVSGAGSFFARNVAFDNEDAYDFEAGNHAGHQTSPLVNFQEDSSYANFHFPP